MSTKRMFAIILLVFILCAMVSTHVEAVKGFGHFQITIENNSIKVRVRQNPSMEKDQEFWKYSLDVIMIKYGKVITAISGILTITLVIVFIVLCVKCSFLASEHWILKRQAMIALLWVGIGAALMGSSTLFFVLFQNMLK